MLQLRYEEQGIEKTHKLKQGVTLIGRLPTCDLVLNDPERLASPRELRVIDTECRLQDAGSRFGTFLNGDDGRRRGRGARPAPRSSSARSNSSLEQYVAGGASCSARSTRCRRGRARSCRSIAADPAARAGDGHLIRLLADVQRTLLTTQSLADVLNRVVDLAFTAVPAERAFLMLRDSADEALAARVLRHRDGTVPPNPTLSRMVVRRVMRERVAILAADATTDPGLGVTDSIMRFNIRSFMCAPLWSREEVIGVLYVDSPRSAQFDADAISMRSPRWPTPRRWRSSRRGCRRSCSRRPGAASGCSAITRRRS